MDDMYGFVQDEPKQVSQESQLQDKQLLSHLNFLSEIRFPLLEQKLRFQ